MAVISGLGRTPHVHGFWKCSSVHPDFTPRPLLLVRDEDPVRRGSEQHPSTAADGMREKIPREPQRITRDERVVRRGRLALGTRLIATLAGGGPVRLAQLELRL